MTSPLLAAPLAIVDLETTGTRAAVDRVTEIAVIEVDGFEVSSQWSTLVDPGRPIPGEVQALTGITHEMVRGAPRFVDLAEMLHERLRGRIFVAHNARFDYGFLRREFERAGIAFHARTLCSVRLSRRLYRGERAHHLDAVIERHRLA
jgi:DNA polymerase-3 subunit epsilon